MTGVEYPAAAKLAVPARTGNASEVAYVAGFGRCSVAHSGHAFRSRYGQ